MSATASPLPKRKPAPKRRSRKKAGPGWLAWWPLLLGIAVTPLAGKAATVLALTGPDALRILYPWMLIPKVHLLGLPDGLADTASEVMMYLQFPLYGVLLVALYRWKGIGTAVVQLTLLHLLAVGLVLIAGRG